MTQDTIATCGEIEEEIHRVLTQKFSWESRRVTSALRATLAASFSVVLKGTVAVCRDPNDDMFLECAALARASLLVAGDKDLLSLGRYQQTVIVTPAQYIGPAPVSEAA